MPDKPFRLLPQLTPENQHFWTGGAAGQLRFLHCASCRYYVHPPSPRCPRCLSAGLEVKAVSGQARLLTFTINHQPWIPGFDPPYAIGIVELVEQQGLRLTTNVVNCPLERIRIDMRLQVVFEERDEGIYLPLFEPAGEPGGSA